MDWSKTELQQAIDELAPQVLADADPWAAVVEAELLDLDGVLELTSLLIQSGRTAGSAPLLETLVLGAPIREHLPGPAHEILTAGLLESEAAHPRHATTTVTDGRATGTKICVPSAHRATRMVVPARDGLYAVRLEDCEVELQQGTDDRPLGTVRMRDVPVQRLGSCAMLEPWLLRVHTGIAALQLGLSQQGLEMTAAYVRRREQFGRPIGSFQAVTQRIADAWIDTSVMEATLWQAAWRLSEGMEAEREVQVARWHATEGAHRVLATAQHLHGGFGFDRDYPLHHYFLTSRAWEFVLGGAHTRLTELGNLLATSAQA